MHKCYRCGKPETHSTLVGGLCTQCRAEGVIKWVVAVIFAFLLFGTLTCLLLFYR